MSVLPHEPVVKQVGFLPPRDLMDAVVYLVNVETSRSWAKPTYKLMQR